MPKLELFDKNGTKLELEDVLAMLLPNEDEFKDKLSDIKESDFEDNEKTAKREYGHGFRMCYFWIKHQYFKNKNL